MLDADPVAQLSPAMAGNGMEGHRPDEPVVAGGDREGETGPVRGGWAVRREPRLGVGLGVGMRNEKRGRRDLGTPGETGDLGDIARRERPKPKPGGLELGNHDGDRTRRDPRPVSCRPRWSKLPVATF